MPPSHNEKPLFPVPRMVQIHGIFRPEGKTPEEVDSLMDLWLEVQDPIARARNQKQDREDEEWQQLSDAIDKLSPLVTKVLDGRQEVRAAAENADELVPDLEMRKKVFDWYEKSFTRTQEQAERERAELKADKEAHAMRKKQQRDSSTILNALVRLSDAVEADEPGASEALLEAATTATTLLSIVARKHPERFKTPARNSGFWPVLATPEPGWEKDALEQVEKLELGKVLSKFKTHLRKLRGSDIHLPARRWAKSAVRTIDETRWRFPFFIHIVNELGGHDEWANFAVKRGWDTEKYPSWVSAAIKLKPFSIETADDWKAVVREIIREQMPEFHLRPEWAMQRATAEANGKHTPGEIQNAILDDIVSALKRLAPEANC